MLVSVLVYVFDIGQTETQGLAKDIKNLVRSNAKILNTLANLSSSFSTSPYSGQPAGERPQARRGARAIRNGEKAFSYMNEIREALDTPMNQDYTIDYTHSPSDGSSLFSIKHHDDDMVVYECPGTHQYVKSTLLALGLLHYDVAAFVEWLKDNNLDLCESLSPEGSELSVKYSPNTNQDPETDTPTDPPSQQHQEHPL